MYGSNMSPQPEALYNTLCGRDCELFVTEQNFYSKRDRFQTLRCCPGRADGLKVLIIVTHCCTQFYTDQVNHRSSYCNWSQVTCQSNLQFPQRKNKHTRLKPGLVGYFCSSIVKSPISGKTSISRGPIEKSIFIHYIIYSFEKLPNERLYVLTPPRTFGLPKVQDALN